MENKNDSIGTVQIQVSHSDWLFHSPDFDQLAGALSAAQGAIAELVKDATAKVKTKAGGEYSYDYLSLHQLTEAIKKPMADNGLALLFSTGTINEKPVQFGKLIHKSGQFYSVACPIYMVETTMQAIGSAKTYARRYVIQDLFNIAADEDDDGQAASGNSNNFSKNNQQNSQQPLHNYAPNMQQQQPRPQNQQPQNNMTGQQRMMNQQNQGR